MLGIASEALSRLKCFLFLIFVVYVFRGVLVVILVLEALFSCHFVLKLLLQAADLILYVVFVLLLCLLLGHVDFRTEPAAHTLVDVTVWANRVVCQ